jgi:hypothetical protein
MSCGRKMIVRSASQSRPTDSTKVFKTVCRSNAERLMTLSTSVVAVCCFNASLSSRVSRATSVSWPAADELRRRTAFGALPRVSVAVLRRVLAGPPLALDRRLIGSLYARDKVFNELA